MYRRSPLLLWLPLLFIGCTGNEGAGDSAARVSPPPVVVFDASDYRFDGPTTVRPGLTTIRMRNLGPGLHHIQLLRLTEGHALADFTAAMAGAESLPPWVVEMGGPNVVVPGDSSEAMVDLVAGRYVMLCAIPDPDGLLHLAKGMIGELVVEGEPTGAALAGEPDVVMTLDDYAFGLSAPLTAGRNRIRVENVAQQAHEVVLFQLSPGAVAADIPAWLAGGMQGPLPGRPVGGIVGIDPGVVNEIVLDLAAGEYALICFLPDAGDGQMHLVHGMIDQVTVM